MTTTAEVPGRYPIGINGVGYMLEEDGEQPAIVHQSIRTQREQAAGANANIGEATVNPEGYWRRSIDDWSHGAGQRYYDRADSDPARFRSSSGVNVFGSKHAVSLLNDTGLASTLASQDSHMVRAGSRVYVRDNNTVKYTSSPFTTPWVLTTVTGTSTGGIPQHGLASDGTTVYIAYGANGIYTTSTASSVAASFVTGTVSRVWWANGRLIAAEGAAIYNPVAAGALPSALLTLPTGWTWKQVTAGLNFIYMLATNGQVTLIYKTTIKADGTALDVPTVAGELAAGAIGAGIFSYLNFVFVASERGVQMASVDGDGNLVFGSTIPAISAAGRVAFTAYDRFVYVGSSGEMVAMDLSVFTAPNTPAYASDIAFEAASPTSALFVGDDRVVLCADKAFVELGTPVEFGIIDSGGIALDIIDPKTPVAFDVEAVTTGTSDVTESLAASIGGVLTEIGVRSTAGGDDEFVIEGFDAARQFEIRTRLNSGDGAPALFRHTLKAEPNVNQSRYRIYRLLLHEDVVDYTSSRTGRSPSTDVAALEALQEARTVVEVQEGDVTFNGTIRDMDFVATSRCASADDGSHNGVATVRVKELPA